MATGNPYQNPMGGFPSGPGPMGQKPANYLVQSILVTLCCCLPFGIASIVFAAQVDSKWNQGDHAGAIAASQKAKQFMTYGIIAGVIVNVLVIGLQIFAGIMAAQQQPGGGF
jgi:large-conductance mechanosensitive channel